MSFACNTRSQRAMIFLHAFSLYCSLFLSIYALLLLTAGSFTEAKLVNSETLDTPSMPPASACLCLDNLPVSFFISKRNSAYSTPCYIRRTNFLLLVAILLSGDVELNPGPNTSCLSFFTLNVRSASVVTDKLDKPCLIREFITDNDIDFLILTETWLSPESPPSVQNLLTPANYSIIPVSRPSGRGGGIAVIYKSSFTVRSFAAIKNCASFEHLLVRFTFASKCYTILGVYRPPSLSGANFIADFSSLLESLASSPSELIILGDFNIHVDVPSDSLASSFRCLLDSFSLSQHVVSPTHNSGHTLDLLITSNLSNPIQCGTVDPLLSDHCAVFGKLSIVCSTRPHKMAKQTRCFKSIDLPSFHSDILSSSLFSNPASTLTEFISQFHTVLTSCLDKHAPLKTILVRAKPAKPYLTPSILAAKTKRSRLESIFRKNKTEENRSNFRTQAKLVNRLITAAKRQFYRDLISSLQQNSKKLWATLDTLLGRNFQRSLPNAESPSQLAGTFLNFFNDKIQRLSSSIPVVNPMDLPSTDLSYSPLSLSCFHPASADEILDIIAKSNDSTCSLDIIPTKFLKANISIFLYPITHLVNLALSEGSFPSTLKHAIVTPLIKKSSLPKDDLSSYRPISNLNFISKIIEKVIYNRLTSHLDSFPSLSPFQSAYRKFHSTETALLRI